MSIFDFPSRKAWAALAVMAAVAYAGLAAQGIAVHLAPIAASIATVAGCLAGCAFYTSFRPDRRLATMTAAAAFLIAFGACGAPLAYAAAGFGGPLQDATFIGFERALGVDWPAFAGALSADPIADRVLSLVYRSSLPQIVVAVVVLAHTGRSRRLACYLGVVVATLCATIVAAAVAPVLGPIAGYRIDGGLLQRLGEGGKGYLADLQALRHGTFAVFDLGRAEGIIAFPSFHCVLAVTTAWALAPVRRLGPAAVALNLLVVVSTVPQGGHYVADILAGSLIAGAAIVAASRRPALRAFGPGLVGVEKAAAPG